MEIASDILRGHLEPIILKIVSGSDRYAYELQKIISDKINYEFNAQSLYSAIRRLETQKLLKAYWGDEASGGGRRKYYSITDEGREALLQHVENWKFARSVINSLLDVE